ncbi:MAG: 5'-nucleotidase C-terminal domain-containing protein, partial [Ruminiclostridium sp.]|nr:5'-nucleotidase C-terminal domain-containing protein [Ruminiclostridium sp.]
SVRLDEHGEFLGVFGEYRVKNVLINGEPLDTEKIYTLAAHNYYLENGGDGYIFSGKCKILKENMMTDAELLATYIRDNLSGVIPEKYSNPYGEGRIKISAGAAASGDVQSSGDDAAAENPATGTEMPVMLMFISLAVAVVSGKNISVKHTTE